jgi:hypothetical protein
MAPLARSFLLLVLFVLGCSTNGADQKARVTVTGQRAAFLVSPVSPWSFYGPPPAAQRSTVCFVPRGLPSEPTASITFEFMPEGTSVSRLLLQQPWIRSKPLGESQVTIASGSYQLFHREGEITELWFAIVPLQGEVLVASLTIAKGFEQHIPQFRSDFERMLSTLKIRPLPI